MMVRDRLFAENLMNTPSPGAPGGIRTLNQQLRRLVLCPLRYRGLIFVNFTINNMDYADLVQVFWCT